MLNYVPRLPIGRGINPQLRDRPAEHVRLAEREPWLRRSRDADQQSYSPKASLYQACISSSLMAVVRPDSYSVSIFSRIVSSRGSSLATSIL